MSQLFEPTFIKGMIPSNRFVRSATWEGLAGDDGSVSPRLIDVMTGLARGGIGLIITSHAYVTKEGQAGRWQVGAYSEALIPGLTRMAAAVHALGGTIIMQIAHAGCFAATRVTGIEAVGPSSVRTDSGPLGREMSLEEIAAVRDAFVGAASYARAAGFDGVQLHAAHGYLLSQFLSPFFNKRQDEYGGAVQNRTRLALEILLAVRKEVGSRFPVTIKLNSEDFLPGGFSVDDMVATALMLEEAGIDLIEMSGGTVMPGQISASRRTTARPGEPEAYYEEAARRYKEAVKVPLALVGGIRSLETAERLIAEGLADYIALARPLIREPDLVSRWKLGDRRPAFCISDSGCFKPAFAGKGISCVVKERQG